MGTCLNVRGCLTHPCIHHPHAHLWGVWGTIDRHWECREEMTQLLAQIIPSRRQRESVRRFSGREWLRYSPENKSAASAKPKNSSLFLSPLCLCTHTCNTICTCVCTYTNVNCYQSLEGISQARPIWQISGPEGRETGRNRGSNDEGGYIEWTTVNEWMIEWMNEGLFNLVCWLTH